VDDRHPDVFANVSLTTSTTCGCLGSMLKSFFTKSFHMLVPMTANVCETTFASEAIMTLESERVQRVLDDAFAKLRQDYPEVVQAIEAMNISFAEYLTILSAQTKDVQTISGNAQTPA
jgi:hypothetical protein